jgi:tRNA threonylcarbamoyl adenosine modification protein (Sua5/YciO/YrdC/YwlC family)
VLQDLLPTLEKWDCKMSMLLKIHPQTPSQRQIRIVVECLRDGGIVIFPSDTIYAIGCDIYQSKAIDKICEIKGINKSKSRFSFVCSDLSHLSKYTTPISNPTFKLMRNNLPGPFTFILKASNEVPRTIQDRRKTVGIRIPNHNVPIEIVNMLGNPIMSTSVRDEDEIIEYTTDPSLIYEKYSSLVDIVIDSGYGDNIPSTVVDCTDTDFEIIRQGKGELVF